MRPQGIDLRHSVAAHPLACSGSAEHGLRPQQAKLQVGVCWFIEVLVRDSAEPSAQCDLAGASRMAATFA